MTSWLCLVPGDMKRVRSVVQRVGGTEKSWDQRHGQPHRSRERDQHRHHRGRGAGRRNRSCNGEMRRQQEARPYHREERPQRRQSPVGEVVRQPVMVDRATSPVRWQNFQCLTCGMKFTTKRNWQRHARTVCNVAPGATPYQCQLCPLQLQRRDEMRRHYRRKHNCFMAAGVPLPTTPEEVPKGGTEDRQVRAPEAQRVDRSVSPPTERRVIRVSAQPGGGASSRSCAGAVGGVPPELAGQPQNPRRKWKAKKGASFGEMDWSAGDPVGKDLFCDSGKESGESDWDQEEDWGLDL